MIRGILAARHFLSLVGQFSAFRKKVARTGLWSWGTWVVFF